MLTLRLNGLDVDCVIGERMDERIRLQRLRIDAELEIDDASARTDELEDTVDYPTLADRIRRALCREKCQMIERAAKIAFDECLADSRVHAARVTVTKSGTIAHLESCSAIYEGRRNPS